MKNTIIWVIVIIVLVVGVLWYTNRSTEEVPAPVTSEQEEVEEEPRSFVVALSAQNDSGMTGVATFTDVDGSTLVELDLSGAPEEVVQPAHIHTGSCADIGGIVYPLESPVNGISETTLNVSVGNILDQLPLALNVHKSPEETDIYVACGDLI